jgi:hypothetical protein
MIVTYKLSPAKNPKLLNKLMYKNTTNGLEKDSKNTLKMFCEYELIPISVFSKLLKGLFKKAYILKTINKMLPKICNNSLFFSIKPPTIPILVHTIIAYKKSEKAAPNPEEKPYHLPLYNVL